MELGLKAVSGLLSDDRRGLVVRIAEEDEFRAAGQENRRPEGMIWPLALLKDEG